MKIIDLVQLKIDRLPKGYVFTYKDLIPEVDNREAIIKSLNRLANTDKINKLSKGKYYKPETTVFGELEPAKNQVVKDLLEKGNKIIGYLTGYSIYNQLGLTTQVSNTIQIGRNDFNPPMKRGMYKITFVKQKNTITKENIPFLQILDAIRYIKKIPDTAVAVSCTRLQAILKGFSSDEIALLTRLVMKYPQSTRELTGAMLEALDRGNLEPLQKSLNQITVYRSYDIPKKILPTAQNWNIR